MIIYKSLLLFSIFLYGNSFAETPVEYSKKVEAKIDEIPSLAPNEYLSKINSYREEIDKFIEHKKRVCSGEFSLIVLDGENNNESDEERTYKLSKEERKLCIRELQVLQLKFINNMFIARKNFLENGHKKSLEELEEARNQAVKNLKDSFN